MVHSDLEPPNAPGKPDARVTPTLARVSGPSLDVSRTREGYNHDSVQTIIRSIGRIMFNHD